MSVSLQKNALARFFGMVCCLLLTMIAACTGEPEKAAQSSLQNSMLEFIECGYRQHFEGRVKCGVFTSPIARGEFSLPLTVIQTKAKSEKNEAVIFIPGGPGQGNMTREGMIEYWVDYLAEMEFPFDFILYSPRGTYGSLPNWQCAAYETASLDFLAEDISVQEEIRQGTPIVKKCLLEYDDFLRANIPQAAASDRRGLTLLSSFEQAKDVQDIMSTLGYSAWHIWAESYGTRVALLAASTQIKSMLLDSPYPLHRGKMTDWIESIDKRFAIHRHHYRHAYKDRQFERFQVLWDTVLQRVQTTPYTLEASSGANAADADLKVLLNKNRLTAIAFYVLYLENLRFPFYEMLEYIALDYNDKRVPYGADSASMITEKFLQAALSKELSFMSYYTVDCLDNKRQAHEVVETVIAKYSQYLYLTESMWAADVCRIEALTAYDEQLRVDSAKPQKIPLMILVGEYDPVTPVEWAQELKNEFADQALLYVAPGVGHGVSANSDCDSGMLRDFFKGIPVDPANYCEERE